MRLRPPTRLAVAALAALSVLVACATPPATDPTAVHRSARQRDDLRVGAADRARTMAVYTSHALDERHPAVRRAVVVVHGNARNADDYFQYAADAVGREPHVAIIAPHFATLADDPNARRLVWSSDGWKQGDESRNDGLRLSSFAVVDRLIEQLDEAFPGLDAIVLVGHSAGGQFVQRYAATTRDGRLTFIVANPSSYMYLSAERPAEGGRFATPRVRCAYNAYKYGLADLNDHLDRLGAETLRTRYRDARVVYLLGEDDRSTRDEDLDRSCAADTQGPNRFARGVAFHASLGRAYGPGVYEQHRLILVPGVGHSAREMLNAAAAASVIVGRDSGRVAHRAVSPPHR